MLVLERKVYSKRMLQTTTIYHMDVIETLVSITNRRKEEEKKNAHIEIAYYPDGFVVFENDETREKIRITEIEK